MTDRPAPAAEETPTEAAWRVASRLASYRGEERATLVRMVTIVALYGVELSNRYGIAAGSFRVPPVDGVGTVFHALMSTLALLGALTSATVLVALRNRRFPAWLIYATTGVDLFLTTCALMIADGPSSPLVVLYFPILAVAALRFSPNLVRATTVGTLGAYGLVVASALQLRPEIVPAPHAMVLFAIALVAEGAVLELIVREGRHIAEVVARQFGDRR